jgi:hypothetical protein
MLAQYIAHFPQRLHIWQADQSDPKNYDYGERRPTAPRSRQFPLKDNGEPLLLADAAACNEANLLAAAARTEWAKSVRLARTNAERAQAEEKLGWGMLLLSRAQDDRAQGMASFSMSMADIFNPRVIGLALVPDNLGRQPLDRLIVAATLTPGNVLYWQAVGDGVWLDWTGGFDAAAGHSAGTRALIKSLLLPRLDALQSHNAGVWYRLYCVVRRNDAALAAVLLQRSIKYAPNCAELRYETAMALFDRTRYDGIYDSPSDDKDALTRQVAKISTDADRAYGDSALAQMEAGNACKTFDAPYGELSIPTAMRAAWDYWNQLDASTSWVNWNNEDTSLFGEYNRYRNLARLAAGFARVAAYDHDNARASRAIAATIGIGNRMAGNWPLVDSRPDSHEVVQAIVGGAITEIALNCNVTIAEKSGDAAAIAKAKAAVNAFNARAAAYRKRRLAQPPDADLFDAY